MLRSRSAQNMDAKEGPVLEIKRSASQLEKLLLELGLVSAIDVFDREPLVLRLCKFAGIEEAYDWPIVDGSERCP